MTPRPHDLSHENTGTAGPRREAPDRGPHDRAEWWDGIWAGGRPEDMSWYQSVPRMSLELVTRYADPDARIVDVGGGASRLVDLLLHRGYRRLAVLDVSSGGLDRARERLGEGAVAVDWIVADLVSWSPSRPVDLWHDRAVYHFFVTDDDREAYVAAAARAVRPGGYLVMAVFRAGGPARCSGLAVQGHDTASLRAGFDEDFELVETREDEHLTPAGVVQPFVHAVFRRR